MSLLLLASSTLFFGCADDASTTSDTPISDADDADISSPDAGGSSDDEQAPDVGSDAGDNAADVFAPDASGDPNTDPDAALDPDSNSEDPSTPSAPLFDCPAGTAVADGWNTVEVGGAERSYHIDLPADASTPPAMLFGFHGFSGPVPPREDAEGFRQYMLDIGLQPDARADLPFILVLIEDTNLQPIAGLDWDIRTDAPNVDIPFFETVVGCLAEHQGADDEQVFAFGFSAGATIANLIHSKYPDVLRAFVSESGLWANEENNVRIAHQATLGLPLVNWQWPALEPVTAGSSAILLTRGGPGDLVPGAPGQASLDEAGEFARDALVANGRVVIDCWHDGGHVPHPEVNGALMLDFFAAHTTAGPSPLLNDTLPSLPGSCEIVRP